MATNEILPQYTYTRNGDLIRTEPVDWKWKPYIDPYGGEAPILQGRKKFSLDADWSDDTFFIPIRKKDCPSPLDDIEYFRQKLFAATRIPKEFFLRNNPMIGVEATGKSTLSPITVPVVTVESALNERLHHLRHYCKHANTHATVLFHTEMLFKAMAEKLPATFLSSITIGTSATTVTLDARGTADRRNRTRRLCLVIQPDSRYILLTEDYGRGEKRKIETPDWISFTVSAMKGLV